jgi:hypothetical protein
MTKTSALPAGWWRRPRFAREEMLRQLGEADTIARCHAKRRRRQLRPQGSGMLAADPTDPQSGLSTAPDLQRAATGGADTIADGRETAFGLIPLVEAMSTINAEGCVEHGPFAIVDASGAPLAFVDGAKRSPFVVVAGKKVSVPLVILAEDGTWHRPMTPLELARLQDLPAFVDGEPLKLAGENVGAWVERIGNMVPVGTAQAIAVQMLTTLLAADVGAGLAPSGGAVWVEPHAEGARL